MQHPLIELVLALAIYALAALWAKSAALRAGLPKWAGPVLLAATSR